MHELLIRDVTRAGRELGRSRLTGLPRRSTLGELLELRIRTEVEAYNEHPGPVFVGLVQPADSIRHSDGFRMRRARPVDADLSVAAAREAVASGLLGFQVGDEVTRDLGRVVDVDELDEVLVVLERPVVAEL